MFEPKKDTKQIAICGTGQGWQLIPPMTNKVVYCLNDFIRTEKYRVRPDVLFIMDVLSEKPQIVSGFDNLGGVVAKINELKVPFIAPYKYEEIPLSQAFPIEEAYNEFGWPYFGNTIAYMICYALLDFINQEREKGNEGRDLRGYRIDTYGINQAGSVEYLEEKGSVEYWLGVANGMGVTVSVHGENSQVLKYNRRSPVSILYGYNMDFNSVMMQKKQLGETVVKRLSNLPRDIQKVIGKNHDS